MKDLDSDSMKDFIWLLDGGSAKQDEIHKWGGILKRALIDAQRSPYDLVQVLRLLNEDFARALFTAKPELLEGLERAVQQLDLQILTALQEEDTTGSIGDRRGRLVAARDGLRSQIERMQQTDDPVVAVGVIPQLITSLVESMVRPVSMGPAEALWAANRLMLVHEARVRNSEVYGDDLFDTKVGGTPALEVGRGSYGAFFYPTITANRLLSSEKELLKAPDNVPTGTKVFDREWDCEDEIVRNGLARTRTGHFIYPRIFRKGQTVPAPGKQIQYYFDTELMGPSIMTYFGILGTDTMQSSPSARLWARYIPNWNNGKRDIYACLISMTRSLIPLFTDLQRLRDAGLQHLDINVGNLCFDLSDMFRLRLIDPGMLYDPESPKIDDVGADYGFHSRGLAVLYHFAASYFSWIEAEYNLLSPEMLIAFIYQQFFDKYQTVPTKRDLRVALRNGYRSVEENFHYLPQRPGEQKRPNRPYPAMFRDFTGDGWDGMTDDELVDSMLGPLSSIRLDDFVTDGAFVEAMLEPRMMDVFALGSTLRVVLSRIYASGIIRNRARNPLYASQNIMTLFSDLWALTKQMTHPDLRLRMQPADAIRECKAIYNRNKGGAFLQRRANSV